MQELGEGERRQFAALTNRLKRIRTIMMTMQELHRMDVLPQKFLASDYKENITKKVSKFFTGWHLEFLGEGQLKTTLYMF